MSEPTRVRVRRKVSSIEAAAIAGIVCAVGWSASMEGLLRAPGVKATDEEIVSYWADHGNSRTIIIWLQVLVVATIAFLWFVGVVRSRLGDREPRLFGTVFFGSSLLLAALLFVGAGMLAAPAGLVELGGKAPGPEAVSLLRSSAAIILSVFAPRIATLVMLSTGTLGRVTGALPKWLVVVTYLLGIGLFINVTITTPAVHLMPAWIATVSVVLLVRRPENGFDMSKIGS